MTPVSVALAVSFVTNSFVVGAVLQRGSEAVLDLVRLVPFDEVIVVQDPSVHSWNLWTPTLRNPRRQPWHYKSFVTMVTVTSWRQTGRRHYWISPPSLLWRVEHRAKADSFESDILTPFGEMFTFSLNALRTGLLNCLNARSRGLTFRHRASCI